jgi:predicted GNAT family N-acyltransferase
MRTSAGSIVTYVLERAGNLVGYLTLHTARTNDTRHLVVSELATDEAEGGKGYAAIMMRFADTLARQSECRTVRLNAINDRIGMYEGWGYNIVPGESVIRLDDEAYQPMERQVMYHHAPHSQSA